MSTSSLRHQAYLTIHQWIVSGKLPRGRATSEVELSGMLDMSRTPVRAALQQLEQEGYLRIAPKHGVIILDSSAQRISDLLEITISFLLFSVHYAWDVKQSELADYSAKKLLSFRNLLKEAASHPGALIEFEYDLLLGLIDISRNEEMSRLFRNTASRLFWTSNTKRWKAPNYGETTKILDQLIETIPSDLAVFRDALFHYLQVLKRTWV